MMRTPRPSGPLVAGAAAACAVFGAWAIRPAERAPEQERGEATSASTALEPTVLRQEVRPLRVPVNLQAPVVNDAPPPGGSTPEAAAGAAPGTPTGSGS